MNQVTALDNRIEVITDLADRSAFYEIGNGRYLSSWMKFVFPKTPATAKKIHEAFISSETSFLANEAFHGVYEQNGLILTRQIYKIQDAKIQPSVRTSDLWQHQLNAYSFSKDLPASMLWMGVGTGKSKTAVDVLQNNNHKRILLICPPYIHRDEQTWQKQFRLYMKGDYEFLPLRKGTTKKKAEEALKFLTRMQDKTAILGINYESLWRPDFAKFLEDEKFDLLICDESHKLKAHNSQVATFVHSISKNFKQILELTGTVMYSSQLDVFGQYKILDSGIFGTSWNRFQQQYAHLKEHNGISIVVGYKNKRDLVDKISPITFEVDESVLNLPEPIHDVRSFELSKDERRVYNEMEREAAIDLEGEGYSIATNVLTKMIRLRQITGGSMPLQDWETDETRIARIGESKKELLINILEDLPIDEPFVIFSRFIMDLVMVREAAETLKRPYGEISGRCFDKAAWDAGKVQILGVNDASGEGLDLTRANYGAFFSYDYSIGKFKQCVGRIRRPPNNRFAYFYHLVAKDTIDEAIYASIQKNGNLLHSAVDYLRSLKGVKKKNGSNTDKIKSR